MKVMQIVSGAGINGAIGHCLMLSRELARRGNQVTVVCRADSWIAEQLEHDPVEVVLSDLRRWPFDELRRIAGIVRQRQIEVVHTHMSRAHFFGVLLRWFSGVPSVATAHSRLLQLHWMFNDLVIAVSEATRRFHQSYNLVRANRIVTIHNFIDSQEPSPLGSDERQQIRQQLGAGEDTLLMATIGDVIPRKGHLHLIRALPAIVAAVPRARLAVVGNLANKEYVDRVRAMAEKLGVADRITWAGHRADIPRVLRSIDLFVLASLEESLPLAVLEAMSAGLPVVGTNVGGVPECVIPHQTGLLVPPADRDALAEAVITMLADAKLRRQWGEAARRRASRHFSRESQVASIEAAFASVAKVARAA